MKPKDGQIKHGKKHPIRNAQNDGSPPGNPGGPDQSMLVPTIIVVIIIIVVVRIIMALTIIIFMGRSLVDLGNLATTTVVTATSAATITAPTTAYRRTVELPTTVVGTRTRFVLPYNENNKRIDKY